jgi:hypothetical protein
MLDDGVEFVAHLVEAVLALARAADRRDLAPNFLDVLEQAQQFALKNIHVLVAGNPGHRFPFLAESPPPEDLRVGSCP